MTYVKIEFDLNSIETDDLLRELEERFERMTPIEKSNLLAIKPDPRFRVKSLDDQMKYEFILENFGKLTLQKLEGCI